MDQICLWKIFMVKNRKSEHQDWILHIQISCGAKFQLKLTILNFLNRFAPEGFFWSNTEKVMSTPYIFYTILHIQISLVRNFCSNWQFWFFGINLPKKVFLVKNWKSEHYHSIPHIQISLGIKFPLKLTILIFFTKFVQKGFLWFKTEKVNITMELCIFKIDEVQNFSLNW